MNKNINRRDFLKRLGAGLSVTGLTLTGCNSAGNRTGGNSSSSAGSGEGEMTYRINPGTGDKVSLLGYGCMRWPMKANPDGEGEIVDQEAVNDLVDYALAHGVNYFDT
ncbi:MAG: twin-arginine translocation signal domain-containing protein, partial [Muribaculaceae bacterium]|nr:twin-arginine translocation signal domain-containing protein [Muribaculaceae bacterium]